METNHHGGRVESVSRKRKASSAQPPQSPQNPSSAYDSPSRVKRRERRQDALARTTDLVYRHRPATSVRTTHGVLRTPQSPSPLPSLPDSRASSDDISDVPSPPSPDSPPVDRHGESLNAAQIPELSPRRPSLPSRRYVALLNETIAFANGSISHSLEDASLSLAYARKSRRSQFGLARWSEGEKRLFYDGLQKFGRHDLKRLCGHVRSKSELEIQHLLTILDAAIDQNDRKVWKAPHPVPTAVEVPVSIDQRLESNADTILACQSDLDAKREKRKFGSFWLLGSRNAAALERAISGSRLDAQQPPNWQLARMNQNTRTKFLPAVSLLRLPVWLDLSAQLFMNASGPLIAEQSKTKTQRAKARPITVHGECLSQYNPTIFATAFTDFHNLAVSITRRLVAAALFQATSRLRMSDTRLDRPPTPEVTSRDVIAAVEILGMPEDSVEFFARVARKCKLDVYDYKQSVRRWPPLYGRDLERIQRHNALPARMTYCAVEEMLGLEGIPNEPECEPDSEPDSNLDEEGAGKGNKARTTSLDSSQDQDSDEEITDYASSTESADSELPSLHGRDSTPCSPSPSDNESNFASHDLARLRAIAENTRSPSPPTNVTARLRRPDSPPRWFQNALRAAEWERDGFGAVIDRTRACRPTVDLELRARIHRRWRRSSLSRSRSRSRSVESGDVEADELMLDAGEGDADMSMDRGSAEDDDEDDDIDMEDAADDSAGQGQEEDDARGRPLRRNAPRRASRSMTPMYSHGMMSIEGSSPSDMHRRLEERAAAQDDDSADEYAPDDINE